ncbi:hypothetical protein QQ045_028775 [Rhodiola kirilowii]
MGSHWRKLKVAFGLHHPSSASSVIRPNMQLSSSSSTTSSASSKITCAICLEAMKRGHGQAMFTAECGHTFHFQCIAANVKHGNKPCPICRTQWKDVPFQALSTNTMSSVQIQTAVVPQNAALPRRSSGLLGFRNMSQGLRRFQVQEPLVFDDDEYVSNEGNGRGLSGNDSAERFIEVDMHPEVSDVSGSSVHNNFNVLVHVKAPYREISSGQSRVPVDIVTVLDVSGSMAGRKIELLKQAMGFVIQNLGPSDRLSVVTFSSSSIRQFPLICMNEEGRRKAVERVESLACNGGTNIAEGLIKSSKVIEDRKWKNPVVSVILLSDGKDTCGHSNYQTLVPSGDDDTRPRIPVHAFGFGADHDAALMHSIAENSGGTFSFIESANAIQDAFAQCIGGLLSVAVQELKVQVECIHPYLRLNSIQAGSYCTNISSDSRKGSVHLGDLYADEERNILVSMDIPVDMSNRDMTLLKVHCAFKDPMTNISMNVEGGTEMWIQRPEKVINPKMSIRVDKQRNRLLAAEAMAKARAAAENKELGKAVSVLDDCRKALGKSLSASSGEESWVDLCAELKEMQERMSNRQIYESSGRGYVLSGLSSHQQQRATTRGDSSQSSSLPYQTRFMSDMVSKSRSSLLNENPQQQP